eukprot:CAMPEP_0171096636 /NCGR_PEP_ID=MMETSP0766_2-20121228/45448_1 /TAXON_ID=439317 /ORGANISM="Gambierdiscus australes, Strain CAWD 149" /LENGTH=162 /DNA_ID=CAMNT_0011555657 /DNA_START=151 /DNA_END=640 /DNA_ORIENTATION=+
MCSAIQHINDFEDLFEDRGSSDGSESREDDAGLESDCTTELGLSASGEELDEEEEQHEEVFDVERLRWENREEQRLEQLMATAGASGLFGKFSELRAAIDDAELVGVSNSKLEAARGLLRAQAAEEERRACRRMSSRPESQGASEGEALPHMGRVHRALPVR